MSFSGPSPIWPAMKVFVARLCSVTVCHTGAQKHQLSTQLGQLGKSGLIRTMSFHLEQCLSYFDKCDHFIRPKMTWPTRIWIRRQSCRLAHVCAALHKPRQRSTTIKKSGGTYGVSNQPLNSFTLPYFSEMSLLIWSKSTRCLLDLIHVLDEGCFSTDWEFCSHHWFLHCSL